MKEDMQNASGLFVELAGKIAPPKFYKKLLSKTSGEAESIADNQVKVKVFRTRDIDLLNREQEVHNFIKHGLFALIRFGIR